MGGINLDIGAVLAIGTLLVGLVTYFLKKVDNKIDATAIDVGKLRMEFTEVKANVTQQLATMRYDLKEDMVQIFNATCHERQNSCVRLQDTRLKEAETRDHSICAKISKLEADRRNDWAEQKGWNRKTEEKLRNERGGSGKWQE